MRSDLLASTVAGLMFRFNRPVLLLLRMNCCDVPPSSPLPPPPVPPQLTITAASASTPRAPVVQFRMRIVILPSVPSQRRRQDGHRVADLVRFEGIATVAGRPDGHPDGHVE